MPIESDAAEVKKMIQALYKLAQLPLWDGQVNQAVAETFGLMIFETRSCSAAFKWVPKPPGGRASILWLCTTLGQGVFNAFSAKLSSTCARTVIYKWARQLDMASQDIAMTRLPQCA